MLAIWSVEMALLTGIVAALLYNWKQVKTNFQADVNTAIGGALLAAMNTGAEYGFGLIICRFTYRRNRPKNPESVP